MVFKFRTFSFSNPIEDDPALPKSFSLQELQDATQNFSRDNTLGNGAFGTVYQGCLANGSQVAVKRAWNLAQGTEKQFKTEMEVSSLIYMHPNVLRLRGFCRTKKELLLVYPPMVSNSLAFCLRESPERENHLLNWPTRMQIALGVARGVAHLHDHCKVKIIHCDICTSNILLSAQFDAVVADFGLAKIMHQRDVEEGTIEWSTSVREVVVSFSPQEKEPGSDSGCDSNSQSVPAVVTYHHCKDFYVNTAFRGTIAVIAPEYLSTGKCTLKSDVFAYGNMLLELISGQRLFDIDRLQNNEDVMLKDWISECMNENKWERVVDPNLQGNYVVEEAEGEVRLAFLCADGNPSVRPEMSEVVRILESKLLGQDHSSRSSWSRSDCDSTPYYSFPPSPSLEMAL